MGISGTLIIIGLVVLGIAGLWLGLKSKRDSKILKTADAAITTSENNDVKRDEAIAEIDKHIAEIQKETLENEGTILDLREQVRKAKDENIKAKKKDEVREAINKRNRLKTANRRADIEKQKLEG